MNTHNINWNCSTFVQKYKCTPVYRNINTHNSSQNFPLLEFSNGHKYVTHIFVYIYVYTYTNTNIQICTHECKYEHIHMYA